MTLSRLRLFPDQFQVVPLQFSKDLDAHNPNTPEWREDVGLVVSRLLSKVPSPAVAEPPPFLCIVVTPRKWGAGARVLREGDRGSGRLPCVLIICPLGPPTVLGSHLGSFHLALGDTGSEHPHVGEGQGCMLHAHLVSTSCLHETQLPSSNGPESL